MDQTQPSAVGRAAAGSSNAIALLAAPSNELTVVTNGFLSVLAVEDVRFDLNIYGTFFKDIPSRLGRNAALDSAVLALTTTLPCMHTRYQSAEMFKSMPRLSGPCASALVTPKGPRRRTHYVPCTLS